MAIYRFLADVVMVSHFAIAFFVVLGLPAILAGIYFQSSWARNFWFRSIHFGIMALVAVQQFLGISCQITTLENLLRRKAEEVGYDGDFIIHWIRELLHVEIALSALTLTYCLFATFVLAILVSAPPRWPSSRKIRADF